MTSLKVLKYGSGDMLTMAMSCFPMRYAATMSDGDVDRAYVLAILGGYVAAPGRQWCERRRQSEDVVSPKFPVVAVG